MTRADWAGTHMLVDDATSRWENSIATALESAHGGHPRRRHQIATPAIVATLAAARVFPVVVAGRSGEVLSARRCQCASELASYRCRARWAILARHADGAVRAAASH